MKKTVLITGATSGFGKACAYKFAGEYNLILTGRRKERLESLKKELSNQCEVLTLAFDIQDSEATNQQMDSLPDAFQNIDILINNAGLALGLEKADQAKLEDWEQMIDTNIKGLVRMTRRLLPQMVERNSGMIINIGSIAGSWPYPGGNVYGSTKAFVGQFSRNLRADLLGKNIRVCNVEPGLAETEFSVVRFKGDQQKADSIYKGLNPIRPEDIAESCYWVASQPEHININSLEIMPTSQAWGPLNTAKQQQT